MHFSCTICSVRFEQSNEIKSTICGHIFHSQCLSQWLERSNTCPVCRERTTLSEIHRLYFDISNDDSLLDDPASLKERIQTQQLQIQSLEADVKKFKDKSENFEKQVAKLEESRQNLIEQSRLNLLEESSETKLKILRLELLVENNQIKMNEDELKYRQQEKLLRTQLIDLQNKLAKESKEHEEYKIMMEQVKNDLNNELKKISSFKEVIQRLEDENKKLKKTGDSNNENKENRIPLSSRLNSGNISNKPIVGKKPHPARDLTSSAEPRACNASDRLGGGTAKTEQLPKTTNAEVKEKPVLKLRTRTIPRD